MPLGRRGSRIQVLVDGMEVELRTPDGEILTNVRDAVVNLHAGEVPTIDLTFYMPSVNADVKVGTCWMICPLCGDHVNHNCDEEDGENVTVYRPNPTVGRAVIATGGGAGGIITPGGSSSGTYVIGTGSPNAASGPPVNGTNPTYGSGGTS